MTISILSTHLFTNLRLVDNRRGDGLRHVRAFASPIAIVAIVIGHLRHVGF